MTSPTQKYKKYVTKRSKNVDAINAIADMSSVKRCEAPLKLTMSPFRLDEKRNLIGARSGRPLDRPQTWTAFVENLET